ncbi:hypothetical protein G6F56_007242 [Rhizopus delemar]|uniref:Uncharacterized protein n=1 Tax=Rhizopus stolonifer TaxID=4846 RepID=A0A367JY32_RHIST|nr:hypothetical protein G6F56_007242 [Rhizopus delemar]RCH94902.1 hypothetical protein CU098_010410 [Rhizopus stolonifer]
MTKIHRKSQNYQEGDKAPVVTQEEKEQGIIEQPTNQHTRFISRVSSIPVVQDSLSTVQAIANKSTLGRFALSTASSTLTTVSKYTHSQPEYVQSYYESYIQPHIEKADAFGCRSLDLIETKFPVVTQSTEYIVKSVTVPSYHMVDDVKVKLDSKLKQPANQVAKEANKRFGTVVDNVEAVLNRYLPPTTTDKQENQMTEEANQALRAYSLLNEVTFRLSQRVQEQVKTTAAQISRSPSDLARVAETSALVQRTMLNIQSLQESLSLYTQQNLPPAVTERIQVLHDSTQERLQGLTQQVSSQIQQVIGFLKVQSNETPEWLKSRMSSLVEIANKQSEMVRKEYAREDISSMDKAKNVAHGFQSQVAPVLQVIQCQLNHYTDLARERASHDLKAPFEYLGLTHAPKLAHAQ